MKYITQLEAIELGLRPRNIYMVIFKRDIFTKQSAIHWLRSRNYKWNDFRETSDELMFQQNAENRDSIMYSMPIGDHHVNVILQYF